MKIKQIYIKNFRSIKEETIECGNQTIFIGGNGVGKSTVLKALQAFFNIAFKPSKSDYFGHDEKEPIEITVIFHHFTPQEQEEFSSRIHDGRLIVARVFGGEAQESGEYQGTVKGCPDFNSVRAAAKAAAKKVAYQEIASKYGLPEWKNQPDAEAAMTAWEEKNPEKCSFIKDGGNFFGFKNVSGGKLQRATNFIMVEAVRDVAEDVKDQKASPIGQLMELIVRSAMKQNEKITLFQEKVGKEYAAMTSPSQFPQLGTLETSLTSSLQEYYKDMGISLDWQEAAPLSLPLPQARISFKEGKFTYPVERAGNGVQRAFIISLLHQLLIAKTKNEVVNDNSGEDGKEITEQPNPIAKKDVLGKLPSVILAIEEPELYQHPTKQWHFAQVLKRLSDKELESVFGDVQVLFCTHSPYFVDLADFSNIRMVNHKPCPETAIKKTEIKDGAMSAVAKILEQAWQISPEKCTEDSTKARLHIFGTELSEGFFADGVILVEGPSDKAAFETVAECMGKNLHRNNIAILPVHGKDNLGKPWAVFTQIGIPVYLVWDIDVNKTDNKPGNIKSNKCLQRMLGIAETVLKKSLPITVQETYGCFGSDMNEQLVADFGDDFVKELTKVAESYGLSARDGRKNPYVLKEVIHTLYQNKKKAGTIENIIIAALKHFKASAEPKIAVKKKKSDAA